MTNRKKEVAKLFNRFLNELKNIEKKLDVKIDVKYPYKYDDSLIEVKLNIFDDVENYKPLEERLKEEYKQNAFLYGLDSDLIDYILTDGVKNYKILGFEKKNKKYPIIVKDIKTSKKYKMSVAFVKSVLMKAYKICEI